MIKYSEGFSLVCYCQGSCLDDDGVDDNDHHHNHNDHDGDEEEEKIVNT